MLTGVEGFTLSEMILRGFFKVRAPTSPPSSRLQKTDMGVVNLCWYTCPSQPSEPSLWRHKKSANNLLQRLYLVHIKVKQRHFCLNFALLPSSLGWSGQFFIIIVKIKNLIILFLKVYYNYIIFVFPFLSRNLPTDSSLLLLKWMVSFLTHHCQGCGCLGACVFLNTWVQPAQSVLFYLCVCIG